MQEKMNVWSRLEHNKYLIIGIFGVFTILLGLQYKNVYMYYDDFSYATLSYVYEVPNVVGTQFSFSQIIEFLINHYKLWGGRVISFFFLIELFKFGIHVVRVVHVIAIIIIFWYIYKTTIVGGSVDSSDRWKIALCSCTLFGFFSMNTYKTGIYWYTASILYVISNVWITMATYKYWMYLKSYEGLTKNKRILKCCSIAVLYFFAGWSMEQTGACAVTITVVLPILYWIKNKRFNYESLLFMVSSIMGYIGLIMAPGNFMRLEAQEGTITFTEKIYNGLLSVIYNMFPKENIRMIVLIYCTVIGVSILLLHNKNKKDCVLGHVGIVLTIIMGILTSIDKIIPILIYLYVGFVIYQFTMYFIKTEHYFIIAYLIGAIATQGVMVMAPYYSPACIVPFAVMWFVIAVCMFGEVLYVYKNTKVNIFNNILLVSMVAVFIVSWSTEFKGYYENSDINKYNEAAFRMAKQKIDAGEQVNTIKLKPLNSNFSEAMPNDVQQPTLHKGIKKYYGVPEEIQLSYIDQNEVIGGFDYFDYNSKEDKLTMEGWVGIFELDNNESNANLLLVSEENRYTFELTLKAREDVAAYYDNDKYLNTGYSIEISNIAEKVTQGEYQIGIMVTNKQLKNSGTIMSYFKLNIE